MTAVETISALAIKVKKVIISLRDEVDIELPQEYREKLSRAVQTLNQIKNLDVSQRESLASQASDMKALRARYDEVKHEQASTHLKINEMAQSLPSMARGIVDSLSQRIATEAICLRDLIDADAKARDEGRSTEVDTSLVPTDLADDFRTKRTAKKPPPPATPPNHPSSQQPHIIIMKAKDRSLTGSAILDLLVSKRVACPVSAQSVRSFARHIELTCKSKEDALTLEGELNANPAVSSSLIASLKSPPTYKTILMGVPEDITADYIKQKLATCCNFQEDDYRWIKNRPSKRTGYKDWFLAMSEELARAVLEQGGLFLGYRFCRIRPYTEVQRCRRCHCYGHVAKYCVNPPACDNCGEAHTGSSPCDAPPSCKNCKRANRLFRCDFATEHLASSSSCPTYHYEFNRARERLDMFFGLRPPFRDGPPPPHDDYGPPPFGAQGPPPAPSYQHGTYMGRHPGRTGRGFNF